MNKKRPSRLPDVAKIEEVLRSLTETQRLLRETEEMLVETLQMLRCLTAEPKR